VELTDHGDLGGLTLDDDVRLVPDLESGVLERPGLQGDLAPALGHVTLGPGPARLLVIQRQEERGCSHVRDRGVVGAYQHPGHLSPGVGGLDAVDLLDLISQGAVNGLGLRGVRGAVVAVGGDLGALDVQVRGDGRGGQLGEGLRHGGAQGQCARQECHPQDDREGGEEELLGMGAYGAPGDSVHGSGPLGGGRGVGLAQLAQGVQDPVAVGVGQLGHDVPVAQEDDGVRPGGRLRLVGHHDH